MVVTDMTEARHNEEMLRALSQRLVQTQEAESGRLALELHDRITQMLCAVVFRSQALVEKLQAHDGPLKAEAMKLRELLGATATEVERISRDLRPGVLDHLGLGAALRETSATFTIRTGATVKLSGVDLTARFPPATELVLYRIVQEALRNVEKHAGARHVVVDLKRVSGFARLKISDDGVGFGPARGTSGSNGKRGVGLLGMRERAAFLGGAFRITSTRRTGTRIEVSIPVPPAKPARMRVHPASLRPQPRQAPTG
jgi:signal transduction histidine kinase